MMQMEIPATVVKSLSEGSPRPRSPRTPSAMLAALEHPRARAGLSPSSPTGRSQIDEKTRLFDEVFANANRQDLARASMQGMPGGLEDQRNKALLGGNTPKAVSAKLSIRMNGAEAAAVSAVSAPRPAQGLAALAGEVVAASGRRQAKQDPLPATPERTEEEMRRVQEEKNAAVQVQDFLQAYAKQQRETALRKHLDTFRPEEQEVITSLAKVREEKAQAIQNEDFIKANELKVREQELKDHLTRLAGVGKFLANYMDRGKVTTAGVVYHSATDVEVHKNATRVGVSYQINMISDIDTVNESFRAVVDFNLVFKIHDDDVDGYNNFRTKGTTTFQEIVDSDMIRVKPPVFEIRNAITSPQFHSERVVSVMQCFDPCNNVWAWYVVLYSQMRGLFKEKFELNRFPFVRTAVQIMIQSKQSTQQLLFVPYNARNVLPSYQFSVQQGITQCFPRGNSFKTGKSPGTWNVENHHGFITPEYMLPPMPSGNKFSTFVICLQIKQSATFFLWNTLPIVFSLPVLACFAIWEDIDNVADRMSITLTLLLTMAAYKNTLTSWIPRKNYLTLMDWYMLLGFMEILLISMWVGAAAWLKQGMMQMNPQNLQSFERALVVFLMMIWIFPHLWLIFKRGDFYESWSTVLAGENEDLLTIATDVTAEQAQLKKVIFLNSKKPEPPEHSAPPSELAASQGVKRRTTRRVARALSR